MDPAPEKSQSPDRRWMFRVLVAGALAYEVYALATERRGDTISEMVWTTTARRPLLPFAVGLLCGHFFWQRVDRAEDPDELPPNIWHG